MLYKKRIVCSSEEDTKILAQKFACHTKQGDVFALYGTLGAGKSTFSRYFIQSLTNISDVPSPTFTLVQTYETADFNIYHFDMYRIKSPEEAFELDIEEAFYAGVSLIEWPEKINYLLPKKAIKVKITTIGNERIFDVEATLDEQQKRLEVFLSD